MSLRLLIVPLLLGLTACAGEELTYDTWVAENSPASAADASFKSAAGKTCIRGSDKADGEAIHTSEGDVHHYVYSCTPPAGQGGSSFDFFGL